jgi:repressor of nif and glnA expression
MPRKKVIDKILEIRILKLLTEESKDMSLKEITEKINKKYYTKRSPKVIERHILLLIKEGKIIQDD